MQQIWYSNELYRTQTFPSLRINSLLIFKISDKGVTDNCYALIKALIIFN